MGVELSSGARLVAMLSQIEQRVDRLEERLPQITTGAECEPIIPTPFDGKPVQLERFGFMRATEYMLDGRRVRGVKWNPGEFWHLTELGIVKDEILETPILGRTMLVDDTYWELVEE